MNKLFEGLSVDLSSDDKKKLEERLNEEKLQWQKGAQNDESFVQEIRNKTKGEMFNNFERWLKKSTGSNFENVDAQLQGGERFNEMLNVAINEVKSVKDNTNQELQDLTLQLKDKIRGFEEEVIPQIKQEYKKKFDKERIDKNLTEQLGSVNIVSDRRNPARIYLQAVMQDRYKLNWDEDSNRIDIKTHKDLAPVIDDKPADLKTVITHILDEGGFLRKSNGSTGAPADPTELSDPDQRLSTTSKEKVFTDQHRKMASELGIEL